MYQIVTFAPFLIIAMTDEDGMQRLRALLIRTLFM